MFSAENRPPLFGLLLFLLFLALYTHTLQRPISTADNAEFQLVGQQFGLAHPPGFPLYTIASGVMARLPLPLAPHVKVNLLSAITSSLTLLFVYLSSLRLTRQIGLSLSAAAALGTATTFWQQAVYANVRSLTALFAALCLWSLIRWQQAQSTQQRRRFAIFFALSLGFGFTHHLSLAFIGLVMVLWLLILDWRMWRWLPFGLIGLLPWLYLPLISADLRTPTTFLEYALGLGFGGDFFSFITPADLWARANVMLNVLTFQFSPWLLLVALLGWLAYWRVNRSVTILLGLTFALHTFITATYRAPQTVEYMLPAYVPLAISIALISHHLTRINVSMASIAVQGGLALLIATQFGAKLPSFRALATDTDATHYARHLLQTVPENGQILSNWHWFNSLRLVQINEQMRPDVETIYVVPSGDSYAGNWIELIADGISAEIPTLATNSWPQFAYTLPAGEAVGDATLWTPAQQSVARPDFTPSDIVLGDQIQLLGYKLAHASVEIGVETTVQVAWNSAESLPPASLFVHLVGSDGRIYAQDDVAARQSDSNLTTTTFRLTPRWGALPESYQLLVGAYLADGTALLDSAENPRPLLTPLEVTASQWPPYTRNPVDVRFHNGDQLIGYDVDCSPTVAPRSYHHFRNQTGHYSVTFDGHVLPEGLPLNYVCDTYVPLGHGIFWLGSTGITSIRPNQTLKLTQQFVSTRPVTRDLAVSLSLTGFESDNVTWAWQDLHDSIPAMGAIPTLKWIEGSQIRDPHWVAVPPEGTMGQTVQARVTVYDAFTNRPIPILDERITQQGSGILIFEQTIR